MRTAWLVLLCSALALGCSEAARRPGGSGPGGSNPDAQVADTGSRDALTPDATPGAEDAAAREDAAANPDAEPQDASPQDLGAPDAVGFLDAAPGFPDARPTPDAQPLSDSGTPAGSACLGPSDTSIIQMSTPASLTQAATSCLIPSCILSSMRAACVSMCLVTQTGLSPACSDCFAQRVECAAVSCISECLSAPTSQLCTDCQVMAGCTSSFEQCSGLTGT